MSFIYVMFSLLPFTVVGAMEMFYPTLAHVIRLVLSPFPPYVFVDGLSQLAQRPHSKARRVSSTFSPSEYPSAILLLSGVLYMVLLLIIEKRSLGLRCRKKDAGRNRRDVTADELATAQATADDDVKAEASPPIPPH